MCNFLDKEKRINRGMELLASFTTSITRRKLMEEFKLETRQADRYIAMARKEIVASFQEPKRNIASQMYFNLMKIYYEADAPKDKIKAIECITKLMNLDGSKDKDDQDRRFNDGLYQIKTKHEDEDIDDFDDSEYNSQVMTLLGKATNPDAKEYNKEIDEALRKFKPDWFSKQDEPSVEEIKTEKNNEVNKETLM